MHSRLHVFLTQPLLSHSPGVSTKCAMYSFSPPPQKKKYLGPSPHFGTTLETTFSPLSFGKSCMKIRSAVPENGCLVFFDGRKKTKKNRKNICKTYTHPPHRRLRKQGSRMNLFIQQVKAAKFVESNVDAAVANEAEPQRRGWSRSGAGAVSRQPHGPPSAVLPRLPRVRRRVESLGARSLHHLDVGSRRPATRRRRRERRDHVRGRKSTVFRAGAVRTVHRLRRRQIRRSRSSKAAHGHSCLMIRTFPRSLLEAVCGQNNYRFTSNIRRKRRG